MEVVRERYVQDVDIVDGKPVYGGEHKVGPTEHFEFGAASDAMTQAIGGAYTQNWNPDFLRDMGKDGTVARLYIDKRVAVDVGDPESDNSKKKRVAFHKNGFGYLCIPTGFSQNYEKLRSLYQASLLEYQAYEARHPRPIILQETTLVDEKGQVRRALLTAVDVRVGGGFVGSVERQTRELKEAKKLSSVEVKMMKKRSKLYRQVRQAFQDGEPFRNPFIAPGKRKYSQKLIQEVFGGRF